MPRYFAVGAGESEVEVKNIYMVALETLDCQKPFIAVKNGGTIRCVLDCHDECADNVCKRSNDRTG